MLKKKLKDYEEVESARFKFFESLIAKMNLVIKRLSKDEQEYVSFI